MPPKLVFRMIDRQNRLAIAARSPTARWQTFVRRHIEFLNGGQTVVLTNKSRREDVLGKPTLPYRRSRIEQNMRALGVDAPGWLERILTGGSDGIRTFFDQNQVSHVLVEFGYVTAELAPRLLATGRPVYSMFRGSDASSRLARPQYIKLLRQVVPQLNGIIAVSGHLLDNLAKHDIGHERAIVVPSGVDTQKFRPGRAEPGLCVTVGRLVRKKAPHLLLRAFASLAEAHDLRLEIIGDGDERARTEKLARELGVSHRVNFAGYLPHDEVVARMRRAEIYVQHFMTAADGDSEGMPNVIQEAMACGLPIVTTRHAGIPDHIEDGVTGFLVDEGDLAGFAAAWEKLACDKAARHSTCEAARKYAEEKLDFRVCHARIEAFLGIGKK
ncbi:MAG: glycosyltransferase [Hyphomicrobiales bacterium]|nr:glycosyltransferase [Hyphomicrobiales bacterium]